MPPSLIVMFAVVFILSVVLGVSLSQRDGSVGAPVKKQRAALKMGRIALAPATRTLLERLEGIRERHPALGDEDVQHKLMAALIEGFVAGDAYAGETVADPRPDFALDDAEAEAEIAAAFGDFFRMVQPAFGEEGLATPDDRLEAFRDPGLLTAKGNGTWAFFPFRG